MPCWQSMAKIWSVHAGAKKREDLYLAFENIYPVLRQYRKGDAAPHKPRKQQQKTLPVRSCCSDMGRHPEVVVTGLSICSCCMHVPVCVMHQH